MTAPHPQGLLAAANINRKALFGGGAIRSGALSTDWDISGNGKLRCLTPVKREMRFSQPLDDWVVGQPPNRPRQYIDMTARCRSCANCLNLRAWDWTRRAVREQHLAERTWFGTMTLAPTFHRNMMMKAQLRLGRAGQHWDRLTDDERFTARCKEINVELTKSIKRLRDMARSPIRLVVTTEAHKSGLPHYHALVHESVGGCVHERELRHAWIFGFSYWNLAKHVGRSSWYVAKYLNKSSLARVRASVDYGSLERFASVDSTQSDPTTLSKARINTLIREWETPTPYDPHKGASAQAQALTPPPMETAQ